MQSSFLDVGVVSFYRIFACPLSLYTILCVNLYPKSQKFHNLSHNFGIIFNRIFILNGCDIRVIIISGPYCLMYTKLTDTVFADTKLCQH